MALAQIRFIKDFPVHIKMHGCTHIKYIMTFRVQAENSIANMNIYRIHIHIYIRSLFDLLVYPSFFLLEQRNNKRFNSPFSKQRLLFLTPDLSFTLPSSLLSSRWRCGHLDILVSQLSALLVVSFSSILWTLILRSIVLNSNVAVYCISFQTPCCPSVVQQLFEVRNRG